MRWLHTACPTGNNFRNCFSVPKFFAYLFCEYDKWRYQLYMDIAFRMDRLFNI